MIKQLLVAGGLLATLLVSPARADNDEACSMVICLSTDDMKTGGSGCRDAQKKFFKIIVYHSHSHAVDYGRTVEKRRSELSSCSNARKGDVEKIMAQYGTVINPF